jgi:phosphatidylinositol alpha-1,6-mannosyltransferase
MTHVLVTNDFPPKVGGIQSYLWELWRRLPAGEAVVYTTAHPDAPAWDRQQPFPVVRSSRRFLLPTPALAATVDALADEVGASLVLVDPAWPLGLMARWLRHPYGVVLHGAEVTIPGHTVGVRQLLGRVLRGAGLVVAAGGYPAAEGERAAGDSLPTVVVPPGVDVDRFHPLDADERGKVRARLGVADDAELVVSVSRLVPRKGMDVLIDAAARLRRERPALEVVIAGDGRVRQPLERRATAASAPVRFLGAIDDDELPDLYGCADLFVMLCRNRWFGFEQEGFGIVYLESAAAGVASVAGRSGGSHEAVVDGETGIVLGDPRSVDDAARAIATLLDDRDRRARLAGAARARAETSFTYDRLAETLAAALVAHRTSPP